MIDEKRSYPKVILTKDVIQIFRDILVIFGTLWAFWKAPPIVNQQEIATKNKATASMEQLRTFRLEGLQKFNNDVLTIDEQLKNAPWKDGPTWERLKAVRDLKEKEVIRLENEIKLDKND